MPPSASTPPTASKSEIEDYDYWGDSPNKTKDPPPFNPDDDWDNPQASTTAVTSSNKKNRKRGKTESTESSSHCQRPYVKDVIEWEKNRKTQRDFVTSQPSLSPGTSRGRNQGREQAAFQEGDSGITEEIERVDRHVTCQNLMDHDHRSASPQRRRPSWLARVEALFDLFGSELG